MICFAFAFQDEGKDLVAKLEETESFEIQSVHCVVGKLQKRTILVAYIGMGPKNASRNTLILFQYFRFKALILAGYGGSLVPQLKRGEIAIAQNFSSEELLSFIKLLPDFHFCKFCSSDEIVATPEQKAQFAQVMQCQVVDMETISVADVARDRNKMFLAVRAISDECEETLPIGALNASVDKETNRITPFRLGWYFVTHPSEFKPFQTFVQNLPEVRKNLTQFLLQLIEELPETW